MKLTWHWLLDHLQTDKNLSEIVETLPKLGLEVASVINLAEDLKEFISVKVLEVKKHPNADKLQICKISDGKNTYQVICGAPNINAGQKIAFATVGSKLPGDFIIKKASIRGVDSYGMVCSESELGLSEEHEGILVLPNEIEVGKK